jgi:hypothetical protein
MVAPWSTCSSTELLGGAEEEGQVPGDRASGRFLASRPQGRCRANCAESPRTRPARTHYRAGSAVPLQRRPWGGFGICFLSPCALKPGIAWESVIKRRQFLSQSSMS